MGPIHGVHPNPKAIPTINENQILLFFWVYIFFSKFKKLIFMIPINCNEKTIIINPAMTLSVWEFSKSIWPKKDAAAPNKMNTNENPIENNIKGIKFIFFFSNSSFNEEPDIKEIYPGINGKTQGDKKLINPAQNAIDNSNIYFIQLLLL